MKKILLSLLLAFTSVFVFAQERSITGIVTDDAGEPVIGATVRVPNTGIGALTDIDGSFALRVPQGADDLMVSYVGLDEPITVPIDSDFLQISIGDQSVMIEDIVVTGYTQVQRTRFTGATATVDAKSVEDKSTADITEALAGEVAGLTVINGNGQPGTPAAVRIRGFGSVNGNRAPVYVVDGVIYQGGLENINPDDIANVTVLKDAAATALYGARGANGVIVVTTKKGTTSNSKIQVKTKYGSNFRGLPYYDVMQSPEEYIETAWEGLENVYGPNGASNVLFDGGIGISPHYNLWDVDGAYLIDPATGKLFQNVNRKFTPERRRDIFFNPSDRKELNLSMSGGEGKTNYRTSFGLLDDVGYYLASDYRRYTGRLDVGHQVKPWLRGKMNLNYANGQSNFSGQSGSSSVNGFFLERNAPPIFGVYLRDPNGNTVEDPIFGGPTYDFGDNTFNGNARRFSSLSNIAAVNRYDDDLTNENAFSGNTDLTATFLKDFTATARFGFQLQDERQANRTNPWYGQATGSNGALQRTDRNIMSYTALQMLSYGKQIGDHEFSVNAAHENFLWERKYRYSNATGLADPYTLELSNALLNNPGTSYTRDYTLESYFAFGDYSFKNKYFLNASLRRDGSSRFAEENRWGTFPAIGTAWVISEEDFLNSNKVDFLRLRASYGETGDQGNFSATSLYRGSGDLYSIGTAPNGSASFIFSTPVDPNITWESQVQYNIGLDANVFDRVSATVEYFNKKTQGLFFDRRTGPSQGIALVRVNDGELLNTGFEFDLTGQVIKKENFFLDLSVNGTTLNNELLVAPIDPATGVEKPITVNGVYGISRGKSVYDFYTRDFVGVDPETGLSQWVQFYDDMNSNGAYDDGEGIADLVDYTTDNPDATILQTTTTTGGDATLHYTGESAIPDLRGASRLTVGWKGISLTGQMLYSVGGHGVDGNYQALMSDDPIGQGNWHRDMLNRWQNPGDVSSIPGLSGAQGGESDNQNLTSTRFITKADYLILNNVRLNYELPQSLFNKIKLQGVDIYFSGDNLWGKTKRQGYFPFISESNAPIREAYDPLSTVTGGLNVTF